MDAEGTEPGVVSAQSSIQGQIPDLCFGVIRTLGIDRP